VQVDGFNQVSDSSSESSAEHVHGGNSRFIAGRILLVATYGDTHSVVSCILAECALLPWLQHDMLKDGAVVNDVAKVVRNSTADAFMDVLPDLFTPKNEGQSHEVFESERAVPRGGVGMRSGRARSFAQRHRVSRLQQWKPWLVAGGAVVAFWVLLSIFAKPAQLQQQTSLAANTPDAQALLQNQLQPQTGADSQAQVDLVKSTLKSMGLDPGASGDTGCLVQPH